MVSLAPSDLAVANLKVSDVSAAFRTVARATYINDVHAQNISSDSAAIGDITATNLEANRVTAGSADFEVLAADQVNADSFTVSTLSSDVIQANQFVVTQSWPVIAPAIIGDSDPRIVLLINRGSAFSPFVDLELSFTNNDLILGLFGGGDPVVIGTLDPRLVPLLGQQSQVIATTTPLGDPVIAFVQIVGNSVRIAPLADTIAGTNFNVNFSYTRPT